MKYSMGMARKLVSLLVVAAAGTAPSAVAASSGKKTLGAEQRPTATASKVQSGSTGIQSTEPAGVWAAPIDAGVVAIHMALLRTGKVLIFGTPTYGQIGCCTIAKVIDPVAGTVKDVTLPYDVDIICAGQTVMPDGRVIVAGGEAVILGHGITSTNIFDPISETWSKTGDMTYARWYPTTMQLGDGTTLVVSGLDENHVSLQREMEVYSPTTGTWTTLPASANLPDTKPGYTYQHMILLPSGKIMEAGPWRTTNLYDPTTQSWTQIGNMNFGDRYHGSAVLLPNSQKVFTAGGTPVNVEGSSTATATTEVIDLAAASPKWQYGIHSMNMARYNESLVYLADGTLLAVGGGQGPSKYENPVYQAEIYDPVAQSWTLMAAQQANRTYHSVAALLPDGRVISTGSTSGTTNARTFEIFSPPYLFKGPQPTYTGSPSLVHYGQSFTIQTTATNITKVAFIKASANTHANDMDQRYVVLNFKKGTGSLTVTAPPKANYAPPGYYMLSIVDSNGVPSKMQFVQLAQ
ncbi:MAG: DUF1929 domain-containing protein [Acidobacteriales bacterium]|nr:DUF1929 domain-containing protein [Terriglobales bacterium]